MFGNQFGGPYSAYPFMGTQMGQNVPFIPQNAQASMQQAQTPYSQQNTVGYIEVGSAKEFDSVTIPNGSRVFIVSQNDPYMAFKRYEGMRVVTDFYRLEPVTMEQINGPVLEYATKGELAKLQTVVQQLIDGMSKPTRTKKEAVE